MTGSSPQTRILSPTDAAIADAAALIAAGACVAMPTETVYGLAGDATSDAAVAAIYAAKGRPSFNPLIVHVADVAMAKTFADVGKMADAIAAAFWPGPLTMVLPVRVDAGLAAAVTAGLPTVALRCPAHPAMQALIAASGKPLAAPSANASGSVSPTTAAHVLATLDGRVPLIIDAGPCAGGLESTIIAIEDNEVRFLRPGPVTSGMLEAATGLIVKGPREEGGITAPGQLASHYAPGKPVLLHCTKPPPDAFMIGFGPVAGDIQLSQTSDLAEAATKLFAALHAGRTSDKRQIAVAPIPDDGIGVAINDRLRRAAA
jgi:L-threonylcarbamoyladenylate synthase